MDQDLHYNTFSEELTSIPFFGRIKFHLSDFQVELRIAINIFLILIELSLCFGLKLCYNIKGFYIFAEGRFIMKTNYKKLWNILLDRNMKKELAEFAEVGTYTINKNKRLRAYVWVGNSLCLP